MSLPPNLLVDGTLVSAGNRRIERATHEAQLLLQGHEAGLNVPVLSGPAAGRVLIAWMQATNLAAVAAAGARVAG